MITDPISDMLIRLKNAGWQKKAVASIPYSKLKENILEVLRQNGFVGEIIRRGRKTKRRLEIKLINAADQQSAIRNARRLSRPGRRLYSSSRQLPPAKKSGRLTVLSTPLGILSHPDAKKKKTGGELLFEIW